jgi:hypothetical protein
MNPLVKYYLRPAVRGGYEHGNIGPIYTVPSFVQRGHGLGDFRRNMECCETASLKWSQDFGRGDDADGWQYFGRYRR